MSRVRLLEGDRGGRFPSSNCLLVEGARGAILVDAGCGADRLLWARERASLVVYTHVHPDHVPGHRLLRGVPARVPRVDAAYTSLRLLAYRYAPLIVEEWLDYAWSVFRLREPPQGVPYDPWEEIRAGDASIVMVPAPGHTQGHHLVLAGRHLHLSDIDLTGFGPWYAHPESSLEAFIADIVAAARLGAETYTTSHKPGTLERPGALGELHKYALRACGHAESVARAAGEGPASPWGLAGRGVIYRRYLPGLEEVMRYFEAMIIWKLLHAMTMHGDALHTQRGYELKQDAPARLCEHIRSAAQLVLAEG